MRVAMDCRVAPSYDPPDSDSLSDSARWCCCLGLVRVSAAISMCAMTSASGTGMLRVQTVLCILYTLPFAAGLCEGWRSFSGGVCQAPQSYGGAMFCLHLCVRAAFQHMVSIGACASMQSFASWATLDKLKYSESCSAPWPCQGEFPHRVFFLLCVIVPFLFRRGLHY